jgi:hypothetical protein
MGLRPLACWECVFESCRGHGCLFVVCVVCYQVEVSATGRSFVQRSSTERVCHLANATITSAPTMSRLTDVQAKNDVQTDRKKEAVLILIDCVKLKGHQEATVHPRDLPVNYLTICVAI